MTRTQEKAGTLLKWILVEAYRGGLARLRGLALSEARKESRILSLCPAGPTGAWTAPFGTFRHRARDTRRRQGLWKY
jgi:hypothetical protein